MSDLTAQLQAAMPLCATLGIETTTFNATEVVMKIESKTSFLGAVREGNVVAMSKPLHVGSRTIVIETEIRAGEKLIAKVTQNQAVLRRR